MKPTKPLVVKLGSDWRHGQGSAGSQLVREAGDGRCCIGVMLCQIGIDPSALKGLGTFARVSGLHIPPEAAETLAHMIKDRIYRYPAEQKEDEFHQLYHANDVKCDHNHSNADCDPACEPITPGRRVATLNKIAQESGLHVRFVLETP